MDVNEFGISIRIFGLVHQLKKGKRSKLPTFTSYLGNMKELVGLILRTWLIDLRSIV